LKPALALLLLLAAARAALPPAAVVLRPTSFPGFQARHVSDPVVVFDAAARRYRMYYAAAATEQFNESAWDLWTIGLATSADGRAWRYPDVYEPVLLGRPLREGEVVDAEPVRAAFDSIEVRPGSIVREAGAWRMYYTGWNGAERSRGGGRVEKVGHAIGLATSKDGVVWTKVRGPAAGGAVLAAGTTGRGALSVSHPSVLRDGARLRLWHDVWDGTAWRVAHATSEDGVRWTSTGGVLEGARHPVVVRAGRAFEMYVQVTTGAPEPSYAVARAVSADGLAWRRVGGPLSLRLDPPLRTGEEVHVGSVLVGPSGRRQLFFARQSTVEKAGEWGPLVTRPFSIGTVTLEVSE
jgi:hypothetical protein